MSLNYLKTYTNTNDIFEIVESINVVFVGRGSVNVWKSPMVPTCLIVISVLVSFRECKIWGPKPNV